MNMLNSSSNVHGYILDISNSSTTALWIIGEGNSTPFSLDVPQSFVRIMWYRFLLIIIIFVTAVGNMLVCLAIARERKLQNTTNYFLMSLAIADCLVAILIMPMGMISEVLGYFPLPHYACIIFATMDVLCCTSSIWHMSTMSMDRYFTIRFPFRYGRNKTRRIMLLKIVAVWAISTAISSPVFVLGIVNQENVLFNGTCAPNNASFKVYGSVFAFYIPFVIMITTYALTMRSLRNVLVNKRKYNRERRRKQTFRPLAQLINQYAEIAQTIRRTSSANNGIALPITNNVNNTNLHHHINSNHSVFNKTPYTIITPTSPTDSRTQCFFLNNSDLNLKQDSVNQTTGTNTRDELIYHNNQHLTISYIKSSGSKKKRYHQQQQQQQQQNLALNPGMNRTKNDCDMSTVYEITEYSKSTSSSHDVTCITNNSMARKSIVPEEQQSLQVLENKELQRISNPTTTVVAINTIPAVKEEDASSTTDMDSGTEGNEFTYMQIVPSTISLSSPTDSISLIIPWQYLALIIQYYLFIFPYRSRPLAIESSSTINKLTNKSFLFRQSTSPTSSVYSIVATNSRSVSTQTNSLPPLDIANRSNETHLYNPIKRRKFTFSRPLLPSSSLFTNFFRQSSTTFLHSQDYSTKSSLSLGQRSSAASSSCPTHQPYHHSSSVFRRIESEMDHVLEEDHRPRASSSSSALLRSTYRNGTHTYSHWHRPLRRRQQYQSRSAYFLQNSTPPRLRQPQTLTSTTNTNSSDSSSVFHRFNSRFFSTISHQQQQQHSQSQRLHDERIVAANERKALRVLMIIFCVFVTLWTPFFICTFISAVCDRCRASISPHMWFSITWLGYSSSMANPFIYTIFSDVFRRAFINIIRCRSSDSLFSRQLSTKLSHQKGGLVHQYIHHQLSHRRSPNHEISGTSSPIAVHRPTPIGGSDATIYINRCVSDSFR